MQGVARDVTVNHYHALAAPPMPSTLTTRQRAELLDRLARRYQELLDHALPHEVRLQLGLHTRPDAVDPAWRRMLLCGAGASQPLPPGTSPLELFDGQKGQLLVLGVPGAGKSMLIVELAQMLTRRAQSDEQARIPVVLKVAAWRRGQSLHDWLQPVLHIILGVSEELAAQLAISDLLLLLLDGVDEVATDHQTACVQAINTYLSKHNLAPLVVGCRSQEYTNLNARLEIEGAVEIELLDLSAIEQALVHVPTAQGVLLALQADRLLRELATTPLMVNVLLLAHGGQDVPIVQAQTVEERRQVLWTTYVRRMLIRRPLEPPRQVAQALHYLRWLARLLREQSETDFLIDNLQPTVLRSVGLWRWYQVSIVVIGGLIGGFVFGPIFDLHARLRNGLGNGLGSGFNTALFFGLIGGFDCARRPVKRQETLIWFWSRFQTAVRAALCGKVRIVRRFALLGGLFGLLIGGLIYGRLGLLIYGLIVGVVGWFGSSLIYGLNEGWQVQELTARRRAGEGIHASLRVGLMLGLVYGLAIGLVFGLGLGLPGGLMSGLRTGLEVGRTYGALSGIVSALLSGIASALFGGLISGFTFGSFGALIGALVGGVGAFIQHYILLCFLSRAGHFPFRAVTFLNAMTKRLLLEHDEAFYRFRHLLLRDFIADLSDDDIVRLAREIEGHDKHS
jgi:hypothetical protein